jgi:restriction endonuclease S subunit
MEVRETSDAYKQSEVGLIPTDWVIRPAKQISEPVRGGSPRPAGDPRFFNGDFMPWLTVASLTNVPQSQLVISETATSLTEEGANYSRTLRSGTLIIANSGATLGVAKILGITCCANDGIAALLRIDKDNCPEYLAHFLNTQTKRLREVVATGNGQPNLNTGLIGELKFPLPPTLGEQKAIAEALSDADALIESLSLLLAKKRQIKQGAMQKLLPGKKRLPGFSGEWSEKPLSELFQFSGGFSASRDQLSKSGHLYLHYGDIHTSAKTFIDAAGQSDDIPRLDVSLVKIQPTALLADGDVVFVDASEDDEGVSKHVVVKNPHGVPFISGLHTIIAKQRRRELDSAYLRYCFQAQSVKEQFKFYAVGTKVSGISKTNIAKITLAVPTREEQSAIAELLISIDSNIEALESKLSKVRQLKQGMMQELLTGRIRLIQPGSNVIPLPIKSGVTNHPPSQPAHNWQINEAVVIGVLAKRFGSEQFPLPRKRRVKLMYLLHRHVEGRAEGYLKKAAGPYDPNTKYKGPEAIALKNGYVRALRNEKYEGFVAGDKIEQAQHYFEQWYGTVALDWLEKFHYRKTDDLELLATVDMAMMDLAADGQPADVASVKHVIASHPEWVPKLSRELFSDDNIASAIIECQGLLYS